MEKKIVSYAVYLLILSIVLGAFGAHGLKKLVVPEKIDSFEVGVKYQFYNSLALLIIGFNATKIPFRLTATIRLLLCGVLLFSGSIYLLTINELIGLNARLIGPITPIGGALMITGWCVFLYQLNRTKKND
jgi:uncharacterized membrane protein YgdD (TMEM256/DUF423 family)